MESLRSRLGEPSLVSKFGDAKVFATDECKENGKTNGLMNNWAGSLDLIPCLLFLHPKSVAVELCTFLNHGLTLAASIYYRCSNKTCFHHCLTLVASIHYYISDNDILHLRSPLSEQISHSPISSPTCLHHSYF
jgi:hypothetical protein